MKISNDENKKFYLLPQNLHRNPLANLVELPIRLIVKIIDLFFTKTVNIFANLMASIISVFNKSYNGSVKNFINQRYFLFSSYKFSI